jgi:serine/threonine-protein kinase HipA
MSYQPVSAIMVSLWGTDVGAVASDPTSGFEVFEYAPAWQRRGIEFAPLTMPTRTAKHVFPALPRATFMGLPAALADALPDAFGNAIVDRYLATRGIDRSTVTPLDRLAYQGKRGMGALEFRPTRGPRERTASAVELERLVSAARAAVRGSLLESDVELEPLIRVGTSAGGARAKAVVAWNPATGELRSGQVVPPHGFEHWLVKFDGMGADDELGAGGDYGRIEHAYALMAGHAGIEMAPTRLLEARGRAHFMTQRFDRLSDGTKVHMQTLCGLTGLDFNAIGAHSYEQLLQASDALGLGGAARHQILRRAAFNVAAANCDDHTKNHAFVMSADGVWSLAPAYDITHAFNPRGRWTFQHLMSVNGRFAQIRRADLLAMADRYAIPDAKAVLADVGAALDTWPEHAKRAGVNGRLTDIIATDFTDLRRAQDRT